MFLGDRRELIEHVILARTQRGPSEAIDALLPLQRQDFIDLLTAMDGLPVDHQVAGPAAARVPAGPGGPHGQGGARSGGRELDPKDELMLTAVERLHEVNPMLGLRGVRLGLAVPGLFALQIKAIAEASAHLTAGAGTRRSRS